MKHIKIKKGTLFLLLSLLGFILWQNPFATHAAPITIDAFDQNPVQALSVACCAGSDASAVDNPGALGGERDIETTITGGVFGTLDVFAGPPVNGLYHSQRPFMTGWTEVTWDGNDDAPTVLNPTGLGGLDFTDGGTNVGVHVRVIAATATANVTLTAYTDGTNVSDYVLTVGGGTMNTSFFIPFTDFNIVGGTGVDFTNVGAFQLFIDGSSPGLEILFDFVELTSRDFGDLPAIYANTVESDDGARHVPGDLYLGTSIDTESDGQEDANAAGDDNNGVDDEDGITPVGQWMDGANGGSIEAVSSGPGCLSGWIDWNNDADFADADEPIITMSAVVTGTNTISFNIPPGTMGNSVVFYGRFRLVPDEGLPGDCGDDAPVNLLGQVINGEVEDHLFSLLDWGDAPDPTYPTLAVNNGASHVISPTLYLGTSIDAELDGQPTANADGDDTTNVDDEDGVIFLTPLIPGSPADVDVLASAPCTLSAWIDFNGDGDWVTAGDDIFPGGVALTTGSNVLTFPVPPTAPPNTITVSRFRCTTDGAVSFTGQASDGEVEDHQVAIAAPQLSISDVSVSEGAGSAPFTITLSFATSSDVMVDYATSNGTATAPGDYTTVTGTMVITAGSTMGTLSVPILEDSLAEGSETFTVNLSNPVNAAIADGQGVGTIIDNDAAPVALNDVYTTTEEVVLNVPVPGVLANDFDADLDPLTAVYDNGPTYGVLTFNSDGSFIYTPTVNFFGIDSFTYHANDGNNDSNVATVTINVTPVNDPPIAVDDTGMTPEDTPLTLAVLANDVNVDGDVITVTAVTQPANGTTAINPDNTVTYTPTLLFSGVDVFDYTISDGTFTDMATVTITVAGVNNPPVVDAGTVPAPIAEGEMIQFSGSYVDPGLMPTANRSGATIHWDFGDGNMATGTLSPTHAYGDNGPYTVTLTITDTGGAAGSDSLLLTVDNSLPVVNAGPDQTVTPNALVTFAGAFTDAGWLDTHTILWDLGDGSMAVDTLDVMHVYDLPGVYTVTLTVTDDDGGVGSDQLIVRAVQNIIYLPAVMNEVGEAPNLPDLIVEDITVTADDVAITIRNLGDAPVADVFWVDLYIDPVSPPTSPNQTWEFLCDEGIVWGVSDLSALTPGGSLVLTLSHPALDSDLTQFSGTFVNGMEIYVQVDSADSARESGGVLEIHEVNNGPYNNISYTVVSLPAVTAIPFSIVPLLH